MDTKSLIDGYLKAGEDFAARFERIPREAWDYLPPLEDAWTIRQHVVHLADSDINNFIRIKSCVAQPFSQGFVIREEEWADNIRGWKEDLVPYVRVLGLLRRILADFLRQVPDGDFDGKYYVRDYQGAVENITLRDALEMYTSHILMHEEYIGRNLEAWEERA